jgi:hypothetical protein
MEPFTPLRVPLIFNLRRDPYERAEITSNTYYDWLLDRAYLLVPAQAYVGKFLATFKEYPPRQKAASFSLDQVMEKLTTCIRDSPARRSSRAAARRRLRHVQPTSASRRGTTRPPAAPSSTSSRP